MTPVIRRPAPSKDAAHVFVLRRQAKGAGKEGGRAIEARIPISLLLPRRRVCKMIILQLALCESFTHTVQHLNTLYVGHLSK
jgi:hypothetical protein